MLRNAPQPRPTYWGLFVHLLGEIPVIIAEEIDYWRKVRADDFRASLGAADGVARSTGDDVPRGPEHAAQAADDSDFGVFSGGSGIDQHPDARWADVSPDELCDQLDSLSAMMREIPGSRVETRDLVYDPQSGVVQRVAQELNAEANYYRADDPPATIGGVALRPNRSTS